ncbi:MAG: M23 family metallopeptidase [Ignavibacteriaceae bacterium]|nr:M23 family metallopeptidase [Ignavibacteriaceae bacterium]
MSLLKYFKHIKSFSVVIVPDDTSHSSKARKFTLASIITFFIIYSIVGAIVGYYLLIFTGFGSLLLPYKYGLQSSQLRKVEQLDEQIQYLVKELQSIKSTNEKLRYTLILSDSAYIDSVSMQLDSLVIDQENRVEGNLLKIFKKIISSETLIQTETISLIKPSEGFISRKFDAGRGHMGIDIVVKEGTPVYASAGGLIVFSDYTPNFGYVVIISHSNNYITTYKHCSSILKRERDIVEQGELISLSGNSGTHSSGPHLHFEIWRDGQAIDPETVLLNY